MPSRLSHRLVALAAVAAGSLLCAPASAAHAPRTTTYGYAGSGLASPADPVPSLYGEVGGQGSEVQAVSLATARADRWVSVRLSDQSGQPVLAAVVQHLAQGNRDDVELGRVCAATPKPLRLASPGAPLTVYLLTGRCGSGASVPTTGTVTVTLR